MCDFTDTLWQKWRKEIAQGNRLVCVYKIDGQFVGEGTLVFETGDPDYTIPTRLVYLSRLIVKPEYRNQGAGSARVDSLIQKAKEKLGFAAISLGADWENPMARRL